MAVFIALCAYNEEIALEALLKELVRLGRGSHWRICLVDDASIDRTSDIAKKFLNEISLELIRHEKNQGLGLSLREIFQRLTPKLENDDCVVTLDADGTHSPGLIAGMTDLIVSGPMDLVIASRYAGEGSGERSMPWLRQHAASLARHIFRWRYSRLSGINDTTCGFRCYRGSLIKKMINDTQKPLRQNGFGIQLELLLAATRWGVRVKEVPLMLDYGLKKSASGFRWGNAIIDYSRILAGF